MQMKGTDKWNYSARAKCYIPCLLPCVFSLPFVLSFPNYGAIPHYNLSRLSSYAFPPGSISSHIVATSLSEVLLLLLLYLTIS